MSLFPNVDHQVRMAAFSWLSKQVDIQGDDVLPRDLIKAGFLFQGQQVRLMGPQGIFKPKILPEIPLTITTSPSGPYDDSFSKDGFLEYRYRGTDPAHHENVGLRQAMKTRAPLIYFHGIVKSRYLAVWPVFIVGDSPNTLTFTVAADDAKYLGAQNHSDLGESQVLDPGESNARRVYITSTIRQRLHQRGFREKVMNAYHRQCALCRLKHQELLDAAHIIPDSEPDGDPVVTNGLALCKIHHAAFDRNLLGIRPDYRVVIRPDILLESDGPMLKHGLQGLHNSTLVLPTKKASRPDQDRLRRRFEMFEAAG